MKVLFFGNEDNLNLGVCLWMREQGIDADLLLTGDELSPRGQPHYLVPEFRERPPDWFRRLPVPDALSFGKLHQAEIRAIERDTTLWFPPGFPA